LAVNLWLKKVNGESLPQNSAELVNAFLQATPVNLSDIGNQAHSKAQDSQNKFQSIALNLLKDLELMHEAPSQGGEEAQ
jgi:hypothetical protein